MKEANLAADIPGVFIYARSKSRSVLVCAHLEAIGGIQFNKCKVCLYLKSSYELVILDNH